MSQSAIDICELSLYEQSKQQFLALLDDLSLINVLRHKLYTELITTDPSLAGSSMHVVLCMTLLMMNVSASFWKYDTSSIIL
jgi:hypothetical protein